VGQRGVPRVLAAALFFKRAVCFECLASTQHFSPYLFCVEDDVVAVAAAAAERRRQAGEEERKTASLILKKTKRHQRRVSNKNIYEWQGKKIKNKTPKKTKTMTCLTATTFQINTSVDDKVERDTRTKKTLYGPIRTKEEKKNHKKNGADIYSAPRKPAGHRPHGSAHLLPAFQAPDGSS